MKRIAALVILAGCCWAQDDTQPTWKTVATVNEVSWSGNGYLSGNLICQIEIKDDKFIPWGKCPLKDRKQYVIDVQRTPFCEDGKTLFSTNEQVRYGQDKSEYLCHQKAKK